MRIRRGEIFIKTQDRIMFVPSMIIEKYLTSDLIRDEDYVVVRKKELKDFIRNVIVDVKRTLITNSGVFASSQGVRRR